MNVLVIADPWIPVPPAKYGGGERIVDLTCRGLAARGHRVRLLAARGSRDYGGGLTVHRPAGRAYASRAFRKLWFQGLSLHAVRHADVVINHGRLDYLETLYRRSQPILHWFHNPLTGREAAYLQSRGRPADTLVGVSRAQVAGDPAAARFEVVYNALEMDAVAFSATAVQPRYVVFLGRLTRNKGVHLAIKAARLAGVKLVLGGKVSPEEGGADYFETMVKPHLSADCVWAGEYDDALRARLLAGASALLFPIQWDEPFGLVMIEALAAGVPVIALRRASTPEVISHGCNGFLCDTVQEMASAILRTGEISRVACRASVEEKFGAPGFIRRVEALMTQGVAA